MLSLSLFFCTLSLSFSVLSTYFNFHCSLSLSAFDLCSLSLSLSVSLLSCWFCIEGAKSCADRKVLATPRFLESVRHSKKWKKKVYGGGKGERRRGRTALSAAAKKNKPTCSALACFLWMVINVPTSLTLSGGGGGFLF